MLSFSDSFIRLCDEYGLDNKESEMLLDQIIAYTEALYDYLPADKEWTDKDIDSAYLKMEAADPHRLAQQIVEKRPQQESARLFRPPVVKSGDFHAAPAGRALAPAFANAPDGAMNRVGGHYFEGIGRRKTATARVRVYLGGTGNIIVNEKPVAEYFPRIGDAAALIMVLEVAGVQGRVDLTVKVKGGGITGQTGAVKLGIARALVEYQPELRPAMRKAGLLTRDAREKERKKPGLKRARKAPTYTKR